MKRIYKLERQLAVLRAESEGREAALKLQAAEYERRMQALNHETSRMANYLPREVWEGAMKDIRKDIDSLKAARDQMVGRMSAVAVAVTAVNAFIFWYWR